MNELAQSLYQRPRLVFRPIKRGYGPAFFAVWTSWLGRLKIIAIMGSPRKNGTGTKVVRQIEEVMRRHGEVSFDYLHLLDANLLMCRGCFRASAGGSSNAHLGTITPLSSSGSRPWMGLFSYRPVMSRMSAD